MTEYFKRSYRFSLLDIIDDGTAFVASALVLRIVEAITSSATIIAATSIVGGNYTEHAPQMLGLLEMFAGLAFMIGPMIATFLFKVFEEDPVLFSSFLLYCFC